MLWDERDAIAGLDRDRALDTRNSVLRFLVRAVPCSVDLFRAAERCAEKGISAAEMESPYGRTLKGKIPLRQTSARMGASRQVRIAFS